METQVRKFDMLIGARMYPAEHGAYFDSFNPSTGQVYAHIPDGSVEDIKKAVQAARQAFDSGVWSGLSIGERGKYLLRLSEMVREHAKELADIETSDIGKTLKQSTFIDVPTCADTFEYFARVENQLAARPNAIAAPVNSTTTLEPVGVVACMIPWNYPLIMAAWKIAPALIAGNTVVLKPSPLGAASILRLAQLGLDAGFPKGVVNVVTTNSNEVAEELVQNPQVDMISFTGGTETGKMIMKLAANSLKKISLELGGKSPNIVFADCDQEAALGGTMSAIFMNQGQMCTAGSRLLLEDKIYDAFLERLIARTKSLRIGNASSYDTDFGPLISDLHRDRMIHALEQAKKEGVHVACGGKKVCVDGYEHGFYFEPTIVTGVNSRMHIAQEELFGPVLSVIKFSGFEEAVRLANDSKYGLAACVWTAEINKSNALAKELKCGTVWVNTYGGFYNEASFGGYKQSGFGRELGLEGLLKYTHSKHVCVDATPGGKSLSASWF